MNGVIGCFSEMHNVIGVFQVEADSGVIRTLGDAAPASWNDVGHNLLWVKFKNGSVVP